MNLNRLNIVAITGAGLSVESGIPPYRGENGSYTKLQERYGVPIEQIITPSIFDENPQIFWEYWGEFTAKICTSKPNKAHFLLSELQKKSLGFTEITQNVDGLSVKSYESKDSVIELHGSALSYRCTSCGGMNIPCSGATHIPACDQCEFNHESLRPNVVMFGESISPKLLERCENAVSQCHILLIIGTALHFSYLLEMVMTARRRDAIVVFINPEPLDGIAYYDALYEVSSRLDVINIQDTASSGLAQFLTMLNSNRLIPGAL